MSIALLLEKYDVSTDEGLQKALNDIEKEESEVDEALGNALSRSCNLEGRLRTASQAYGKLCDMKSDAQTASGMVEKTADLARDVSAKVRQLDLARSRVAECQRRVHDLIDLQLCSAGVETALKTHDYETAAGHVARFLSMDPRSVAAARARGHADPRGAMARAADTLRDRLVAKFEEASRKEDDAAVERLFKLFPQIGRAEEGVDLLASYVAKQMEVQIRAASTLSPSESSGTAYLDALTRVLERGGAGVKRVRGAAGGAGLLARAMLKLQPQICAGARRVYTAMRAGRRLHTAPKRGSTSPLSLEPLLTELALSHSRIALYFSFITRQAQADVSLLAEEAKKSCLEEVDKMLAESDLMRTAQDLLGHYLTLERFFLEESVGKALQLAAPQPARAGSSLVDDVFFIARKVIRRAASTGSIDGVCAVLNDTSSVIEHTVAPSLRAWLQPAPPAPLPLPLPPPGAGACAAGLSREVDAQRELFLCHLNEAETGCEWSTTLATEAVSLASPLARSAHDLTKLNSCAGGLAGAAAALRAARELALQAVLCALQPAARAWASQLAQPSAADDMEDDADALPAALDVLAESARTQLSPSAAEWLLAALVGEVAACAEARLMRHQYDRESGLTVERRARRLAAWAGGSAGGARERCARLAQAGALLALERAQHAPSALAAPRLPVQVARDLLARRTDFKIEEIKRLKF